MGLGGTKAVMKFESSIGLTVTAKDLKIILGAVVMVVAMVYGYTII